MKKKAFSVFMMLAALLTAGLIFIGCATDNGIAPVLTSVIVSSSEADANDWKQASLFQKNATIYTAIECVDPDNDVVKYIFGLGGQEIILPLVNPMPAAAHKGFFCFSDMPKDRTEYGSELWPVGDNHTITITLVDSKGNKSASVTSNTFEITD